MKKKQSKSLTRLMQEIQPLSENAQGQLVGGYEIIGVNGSAVLTGGGAIDGLNIFANCDCPTNTNCPTTCTNQPCPTNWNCPKCEVTPLNRRDICGSPSA